MKHVIVIGAGVVGLACAAVLRQRQYAVTVIDPRPPGTHCSLGNAGCLSRASFVPLGLPGMWKKAAGWLLDPGSPLAVDWAYARHAAPWLWRLHRATRPAEVAAIADALRPLVDPCVARWRPLAEWAGVPELIRQDGYAFVYESEQAFQADALGRRLRIERGAAIEILQGPAIREFDPAISPRATHMVLLPEQGHCPNPLRLSQALAVRLRESGVPFLARRASGFALAGGKVFAVHTDAGDVPADAVVVAAGAHSHQLASQLGHHILLETERGYHAMLRRPTVTPRIPIMSGEGKYFLTPMEDGLRVAGTVELAGLAAPPTARRSLALAARAPRLLPGLAWEEAVPWMAHRPSLPDSKPVIGPAAAASNAVLAFGHGHVGLTAAPVTAGIVADLLGGLDPRIDMRPYAPDRPAVRLARARRGPATTPVTAHAT